MNNKRIFRLNLDLKDIDKRPEVVGSVKQLDGTTIIANLSNFGNQMDLSDCLARLFIIRPDQTELYQKEYIQIDGSEVIIQCVDEIFELNGDVSLELEIIDMDGYIVTFPTFIIKVLDKINDDTQREIIRVQEVSLLEELKDYVLESQAKIDSFKEAIDEMTDPDYITLLEGLGNVRKLVLELDPVIQDNLTKVQDAISKLEEADLEFTNKEEERNSSETVRKSAEEARTQSETQRISRENARVYNEEYRETNEANRLQQENLRVNYEKNRRDAEALRVNAESARVQYEASRQRAEAVREQQEQNRISEFEGMKDYMGTMDDKIDDIPNHGNFNVDLIVKGNVYATLDGQKPEHAGPPTKDAGNVILPYARAIGGFTKDGTGVRTIGFIAKPKEADKNIDITDDQNLDSVFLGTNVSQLFMYSKEKFPTIVSQGELSPIATQDWVMRLVDGLGLLNRGEDDTPVVSTEKPQELFDTSASDAFGQNIRGNWTIDEINNSVDFFGGDLNKYKPIIAFDSYNEVTYSYTQDTAKQMFTGLWKTENYIYATRIEGRALSVSYFGKDGTRGGAYNLTIRDALNPGEKISVHYNHKNEIWEFYRFDENNEPVLIYQLSKFMMSGFPEFGNGKEVKKNFSMLMRDNGRVHFYKNPSEASVGQYSALRGYNF